MRSLRHLVEQLLEGKNITLDYKRYNDGTKENPDILINRVSAGIESIQKGSRDIVVYLSKEGDKTIDDIYEIYRIPVTTNLDVLEQILKEVRKQSHL